MAVIELNRRCPSYTAAKLLCLNICCMKKAIRVHFHIMKFMCDPTYKSCGSSEESASLVLYNYDVFFGQSFYQKKQNSEYFS